MTLCAAWIRNPGAVEEMVVATDSRLRAGQAWDCCPKIMALPRSDSFVCFSGRTDYAYPLMLQMRATIEMYGKAKNRAMDLTEVRGHILRVFNDMRTYIHDLPNGIAEPEAPAVNFLFGGFDWRSQEFVLWFLHFDAHISRFTFRPAGFWRGIEGDRKVLFAGDAVDHARERLVEKLRGRGRLREGGLDMEPFEVLRDMIREKVSPEIGGPPQMAKIYKHLNVAHVGIAWPDATAGRVAVRGRLLLEYERPSTPVLDPDSLEFLQR